jgi:hypothetical protein
MYDDDVWDAYEEGVKRFVTPPIKQAMSPRVAMRVATG